jgi:hypothetical protein
METSTQTDLLKALDDCALELQETLSSFSEPLFQQAPPSGGWSPAQVVHHLVILEAIACQAVGGQTLPTNRPPDAKLPLVKAAMEDLGTRRQAPEIVQPAPAPGPREALLAAFLKQRAKLTSLLQQTDLSEACTSLKHPVIGTMTRLEWAYFTVYHVRRHTRQLSRMAGEQ